MEPAQPRHRDHHDRLDPGARRDLGAAAAAGVPARGELPEPRDPDSLSQRAPRPGGGGDHPPGRGGARHAQSRTEDQFRVVRQRRQHQRPVRLGPGHLALARRSAREARAHPRSAAGGRGQDPGEQLPLLGHAGARMPDRRRSRPVTRLRAAEPPRRRSAPPRARCGQGGALRHRAARGADRFPSRRSAPPSARRRPGAGSPRCFEPEPERRHAAAQGRGLAAPGGESVRHARGVQELPGLGERHQARRRGDRGARRARAGLRPPSRSRPSDRAQRHQGVGRQYGRGGEEGPRAAQGAGGRSPAQGHSRDHLHGPG